MVSHLRQLTLAGAFLSAVVMTCGTATAHPQQQPATQRQPARQPAIWGLSPGNRLVTKTTVVRTSSVQIADAPPQESTITDEFEVDYFVIEVSDVGQMIVRVQVNPLLRSVTPAAALQSAIGDVRLPLLRNFEVQMLVGVDGVVEEVGSRTQALESLTALDVPGQQLLLKTCSDGVVGSWFAHPFWLTAPAEQLREDGSWQRVDRHSMGLLGELQTAATITVTDFDARRATVEIQGSSRLVAAEAAEEQPGSQLIEFSDVAVQVDDFSGTGTMEFHAPSPTTPDTQQPSQSGDSDAPPDLPAPEEPDPNPPATDEVHPADDAALPMPRPWFEEITVRLAYSGTATVTANGQKSALRFTQQQTSTSRLQMYHMQRPAPEIRSIPLRQR